MRCLQVHSWIYVGILFLSEYEYLHLSCTFQSDRNQASDTLITKQKLHKRIDANQATISWKLVYATKCMNPAH